MNMQVHAVKAQIEVGDIVCFKSDVEQRGRVLEVRDDVDHPTLLLEAVGVFEGDYIGGLKRTEMYAEECWV